MTLSTAEILCVGTELLLGDIVNTDAAYLSRHLAALGIAQYRQGVIGDNPARLRAAIAEALPRCDLLLLVGGLGPTYDDLTKETVCDLLGCDLVLHEPSLARIEEFFRKKGVSMPPHNRKQAMIPAGGMVFRNDYGTAPGVGILREAENKLVILLPGPPRELEPLFAEQVEPYLRSLRSEVFYSENVNVYGLGESHVEAILRPLMEARENPTLAPYCLEGEVRLRITARGAREADCKALCAAMREKILATEVGQYVYGVNTDLASALVNALSAAGKRIATAESCTGGLIAKSLTDVAGASAVFDCGIVAYANEIKERVLHVRHETLAAHGAVSAETAREMAEGVRLLAGADVGISTTGLAGPGGGSAAKPVGLVYVGLSTAAGSVAFECRFSGTRAHIRQLSVLRALSEALHALPGLCAR